MDRLNPRGEEGQPPARRHWQRVSRISVGAVVFCLALIAAIWFFTLERIASERSQAMENAARQNENLALAYEEDTKRTIRSVDQALLTIKRAISHKATPDDLRALLRDAVADSSLYTLIAVIDARGRVQMSTVAHIDLVGMYVGNEEYFKAHLVTDAGLHIGNMVKGRQNEGWILPLSRRLSSRDGKFAGIVLAAVRPSHLVSFYGLTKLGRHGVVTLFGADGVIRARRTGSNLAVGGDMRDSAVYQAAQQQTHGTVVSPGLPEGIPRILSFRRLLQFPLVVAVGTAVDDAVGNARQPARGYTIASAVATAVILGCLAFFILVMRQHRRSLQALMRSEEALAEAQHIGRLGSWEVRLSPGGEERNSRVMWSDAMYEILGLEGGGAKPSRGLFLSLVHPDDRERVDHAFQDAVSDLKPYVIELRMILPSGEQRHMVARGKVLADNRTGEAVRVIGTLHDVTDQKTLEHQLVYQANIDALTGLPNRRGFHDRLEYSLEKARRSLTKVCVLFIDLDKFKSVNDSLGHETGDELLREMAVRFKRCMRGQDLVARLGGDEFALIVADLASNETAGAVAERIILAFAEPLKLGDHELLMTVSIGVATYPDDSTDVTSLMKNADTAMYEAKASGGNRHAFYSATMNRKGLERLLIIGRLKRALENGEFELVYQPVVNGRTRQIVSCEALLRWQRGNTEVCSPHEFVPALESSGLVVPAGEWVIRTVCAQIAEWRKSAKRFVPVAVNLSARQFQEHDLVDILSSALADFDVPADALRIEITETTVMARPEDNARTLERIANMGVHVAIDDFGTGYSSLSYLKRFHIDSLKIDSSFVRGLPDNRDDNSICRAIVTMAHSLGMTVVAEGVENEAQLTFLVGVGCDYIQGYLFSKPVSAAQLESLVQAGREKAATEGWPPAGRPPLAVVPQSGGPTAVGDSIAGGGA